MSGAPYFDTRTYAFIDELKENNDREWFTANKARYEDHVKDPALRLIQDVAPLLEEISPHFQATPRSLFRIHRDVRFSKDKRPYKTHVGIHFRHDRAKDAHAPGFYLHVEPGASFLGAGIWHPDGPTLRAIRDRIVEDPAAWKKASLDRGFRKHFNLAGDTLTRGPRGYDPDHPFMDDLKRKDFIGVEEIPRSFVTSADLPSGLAERFRAATPFVRFLCDAVGVPF